MNKNKQKQIHKYREQKPVVRVKWDLTDKLLCIKYISNKDVLYNRDI